MNNKTILEEHQRLVLNGQDIYSLIAEEYTKLYIKKHRLEILKEIKFLKEEQEKVKNALRVDQGDGTYTKIPIEYDKENENDKSAFSKIYGSIRNAFRTIVRGIEKQAPVLSATGRRKLSKDYKKFVDDNKQVMNDINNSILNKNLFNVIRYVAPDFPNTDKGKSNTDGYNEFKYALEQIAIVYDSVYKAAADGKLDATIANQFIANLRSYVKHNLDNELSDYYKHAIREQQETNEKQPVDYAAESETIKGLKSNKAPIILAGLGAMGVGFGWLVKQPWFLDFFKNPQTFKQITYTLTNGHKLGVTEHLAALTGQGNISGMKVSDFMTLMKGKGLVDNVGNPTSNLLNLARDAGNGNFANWWATNLAGPAHANQTLAQAIPMSGAGAPGAGGDIFTKKIIKQVTAKIAQGGGLTAVGTTVTSLGPLATILGIGLVSAGAAVKALRVASLKKSRAADMAKLLNQMQNVTVSPKAIVSAAQTAPPMATPPAIVKDKKDEEEESETQGQSAQFYVTKSSKNMTSLADLLKTNLSNGYKGIDTKWQGRPQDLNSLINIIAKHFEEDFKKQGATVQESLISERRITVNNAQGKQIYFDETPEVKEKAKELKNGEAKTVKGMGLKRKYGRKVNQFFLAKSLDGRARAYSLGFNGKQEAEAWTKEGKKEEEQTTTTTTSTSDKSLDELLDLLMRIASSNEKFETKLDKWTQTYEKAGNLKEIFKTTKDGQQVLSPEKIKNNIEVFLKGYENKDLTSLISRISRIGDPSSKSSSSLRGLCFSDDDKPVRTRYSFYKMLALESKNRKEKKDKDKQTPQTSKREKAKYVANFSEIEKPIRVFINGVTKNLSGDEKEKYVEDMYETIMATLEDWIRKSRPPDFKDFRGSNYLGLAESQVMRWKQLSGILQG